MDELGNLDAEEQQKLLKYLQNISPKTPKCEFCGTEEWEVNPQIVTPMPWGLMVNWKVVHPVVMVSCQKCGNTKFFDAVTAGIIFSDSKKKDAPNALDAAGKPTLEEGK